MGGAPGRRIRILMLSINELFGGRHFDREISILCVRWYLRFKLSFRDLVKMMGECGIDLAHTTIMRWISTLRSRIRKAVEPLRLPSRKVVAGRRNLRKDQGPLDLSLSRRRQPQQKPSTSYCELSEMSPPRRLFSGRRSKAKADCPAPSRSMATKPRTARPAKSSPKNRGGARTEPDARLQEIS